MRESGADIRILKILHVADSFMWIKTHFIAEWVYRDAKVTLIMRPRRFGKTTLLSTVETFFDPRFADHPEYFEKLRVWGIKRSENCLEWFLLFPSVLGTVREQTINRR